MNDRIYLSPPHLGSVEEELIKSALDSNWVAPLGPHVEAFEAEVADYVGVSSAVALSSGTAAIHLALRISGVVPGDQVFCSSFTFAASAFPILYEKAVPIFIDSEPDSWNMSPIALERAFLDSERRGKLPRAVIIVNVYGQSADFTALLGICNRYGVPVIEDAAESLGASYKGVDSGSFGKFGVFSFNGNKIITTSGGGMLVSNDVDGIEHARHMATQSRDPAAHYQHSELGFNYRLSNVLAAIGRGQLSVLDDRVEKRRAIFDYYCRELGDLDGVTFMPEIPFGRSTRWLTAFTIDPVRSKTTVDAIVNALHEDNIEARPVWKPLHLQPVFSERSYFSHIKGANFSETLFSQGICLPSGSGLSSDDLFRVVSRVRKCFARRLHAVPQLALTRNVTEV